DASFSFAGWRASTSAAPAAPAASARKTTRKVCLVKSDLRFWRFITRQKWNRQSPIDRRGVVDHNRLQGYGTAGDTETGASVGLPTRSNAPTPSGDDSGEPFSDDADLSCASDCCSCHIRAYTPSKARSAPWVPRSTIRP